MSSGHVALATERDTIDLMPLFAFPALVATVPALAHVLAAALSQRFVTSAAHRLKILQQNCGAAQFPERPLIMSVSSN
jgi:hypothetical protein